MRLLSLNIDNEIIQNLESNNLYIIDDVENLEDAIYHLEVRFYNLVLLNKDSLENCIEILNTVSHNHTAFVILTNTLTSKFEIQCLNNGALCVLDTNTPQDLLMAKLESIHRDNFKDTIYYKNYFGLKKEYKEVVDIKNENEITIRGKSYDILSYLLKNKHRPPISKDEILNAVWDDPELVSDNVIEVNINQIRTKLKKQYEADIIETIRHRGYRIVA